MYSTERERLGASIQEELARTAAAMKEKAERRKKDKKVKKDEKDG